MSGGGRRRPGKGGACCPGGSVVGGTDQPQGWGLCWVEVNAYLHQVQTWLSALRPQRGHRYCRRYRAPAVWWPAGSRIPGKWERRGLAARFPRGKGGGPSLCREMALCRPRRRVGKGDPREVFPGTPVMGMRCRTYRSRCHCCKRSRGLLLLVGGYFGWSAAFHRLRQ